jgi:hypothetical protein
MGGEGNAINLYNIANDKCIPNAPIKGQCARDYIYGEDLELEHCLQTIEDVYGATIAKLQKDEANLTNTDMMALCAFTYLQYCRTDMAMQRMRQMQEGLYNIIHDGRGDTTKPKIDLSDRAMMRDALRQFSSTYAGIVDLASCIIRNQTTSDFITSDDPAVFTSRFYIEKIKSNTFGIGSSGAVFFLPLTPQYMLMMYDDGVYNIPVKNGFIIALNDAADTFALNQLQHLKCAKNVYFKNWNNREQVRNGFNATKPHRQDISVRYNVFVQVPSADGRERYRPATEEERKSATHTLVQSTNIQLTPHTWFSKLKYRSSPKSYSNGSAAGWVRKATYLNRLAKPKRPVA